MAESSPIVPVPGLGSSARTHLDILPALWRHGPLPVADHAREGQSFDAGSSLAVNDQALQVRRRPGSAVVRRPETS